eukprot:1157346-Pelagomonas_calceolata.AAC.20
MRIVQNEIAAQLPVECVMGVLPPKGKKGLWLKGRLRNGSAQSEDKTCLAVNMAAHWGCTKPRSNLLGCQNGCVMAA